MIAMYCILLCYNKIAANLPAGRSQCTLCGAFRQLWSWKWDCFDSNSLHCLIVSDLQRGTLHHSHAI